MATPTLRPMTRRRPYTSKKRRILKKHSKFRSAQFRRFLEAFQPPTRELLARIASNVVGSMGRSFESMAREFPAGYSSFRSSASGYALAEGVLPPPPCQPVSVASPAHVRSFGRISTETVRAARATLSHFGQSAMESSAALAHFSQTLDDCYGARLVEWLHGRGRHGLCFGRLCTDDHPSIRRAFPFPYLADGTLNQAYIDKVSICVWARSQPII